MSLGMSVTIDTGRALMAALQPITGNRAAGQIKLRTKPGVQITIPRYAFWAPVVEGQRMTSWLFKAMEGPNEDKSWTVDDSGNSTIDVMSNIGGMRHNVPTGTQFQPDLPIEQLVLVGADQPVAVVDFEGGTNPAQYAGVQDMAMYETFDGPALTTDMHRSPLDQFPGILLAFQDFSPADGVAIAQNNQMAINAGTDKKFYKITYTISIVTTRGEGDMSRRQEGLILADAVSQLLNDKHNGDVGECLSNPGGVQVRQMIREDGPQDIYKKFYIYTVLVSCMATLQRVDFRTYSPWLRTVMAVDKPQVPELPNQGQLRLVDDNIIDMTPFQLDLAVDGTFVRVSVATLWVPANIEDGNGVLLSFASGERRVTNLALGIYMEPDTVNALPDVTDDFTAWTLVAGATVTADVENDPQGNPTADEITFAADADSAVEFAGPSATAGEPVIFYLFAKALGTKFTSKLRLGATDSGAAVFISDDIEVGNVWRRYRFEIFPTSTGVITLRVQNATDAQGRSVVLWGAFYSDADRWGPEYSGAVDHLKDRLTFLPGPAFDQQVNLVTPAALLRGAWALRYQTPDDVAPDVLGTGTGAPTRTLVSVGDGTTELVTLTLTGTPATGGARLTLATRGGGVVVDIAGLEWLPGAVLRFVVKATGDLTVEGTLNGDGDFSFSRYLEDAQDSDFLVIGDLSDGSSSPAPGRYISIENVIAATPTLENVVTVNGAIVTVNGTPVTVG